MASEFVNWKGKSGTVYPLTKRAANSRLLPGKAGVFVLVNEAATGCEVVYIGETDNLWLNVNAKNEDLKAAFSHGFTHIHFRAFDIGDPRRQSVIVADLRDSHNPIYNG